MRESYTYVPCLKCWDAVWKVLKFITLYLSILHKKIARRNGEITFRSFKELCYLRFHYVSEFYRYPKVHTYVFYNGFQDLHSNINLYLNLSWHFTAFHKLL